MTKAPALTNEELQGLQSRLSSPNFRRDGGKDTVDILVADWNALRLLVQAAVAPSNRESLAQAYALHRWQAKLDNLPNDMVDDCYGFAGEALVIINQ